MNEQPNRPRVARREQEMKFGTQLTPRGVRFRLWAPDTEAVALRLIEPWQEVPMLAQPRGWFELEVDGIGAGARYQFLMPNGLIVPDPASRYQPEDVDGPSEVIDPLAFEWTDLGWRGRPWNETVLYELHIGTFTPEGTFRAAIDKLDALVSLGVTALELMPIADFPGRWNWGYDGAQMFAPDSTYGRPEDLKALIDAAHARNLTVFLDVVYNHFGPKGNYLNLYAPVLTEKHETPWGAAVNYDDENAAMIREFVFANARYWLNEYRFDGLRFDAVHEIRDNGPKHLLQDLAEQIRAATDGRYVHLVAENAYNQAGWLVRHEDRRARLYTAQWSDDVHHCLHCAATGESFGYYADYCGRMDLLGRALAEGLAYQGEYMEHAGREMGEPSAYLPATAFVTFIQNHDQIGNRPLGDRLHMLAPPQAVRSVAAINILSPHIPLLFMGEEWAARQHFPYFSDVGEDLAEAIRSSRAAEFEHSPDSADPDKSPPDPMAEATFDAAKLDWNQRHEPDSADVLSLYRTLLKIRREEIEPRLVDMPGGTGRYEVIGDRAVKVSWQLADGARLALVANLSAEPLDDVEMWSGRHLWLEGYATGQTLEPWGVVFSLEEPAPAAEAPADQATTTT